MPELPEVETIVRDLLEEGVFGEEIIDVKISWPKTISTHSVEDFMSKIINQKIVNVGRRGKYIVCSLTDWTLLIHLRMSGRLCLVNGSDIGSHERVRLVLKGGRALSFEDTRKFGRWYLTQDPGVYLGFLGVEPLSDNFSPRVLKTLLEGSRRQIKSVLLDQHVVSGLGNIYVDEALWEAQVHPLVKACSLSDDKVEKLYRAIVKVLEQGIVNRGTSLGKGKGNFHNVRGRLGDNQNSLKVFRREKKPCLRCGEEIEKVVVAQRGTRFCPRCQSV